MAALAALMGVVAGGSPTRGEAADRSRHRRAARAFEPVRVLVRETDGVERGPWPVRFGVPMPRGALREVAGVGVVAEDGSPRPVQARVSSRWADGSVRWFVVDSTAHVPPNGRETLLIAAHRRAAAGGVLSVKKGKTAIDVNTGAMRFRVPLRHFGIVEDLRAGGAVLPGPLAAAMTVDGVRREAAPPRAARVVESGPLRARVELEGTYGGGFDYRVLIDAYAGQPFIRIRHTFVDRQAAPVAQVARIRFETPLAPAGAPTAWRTGVEGAPGREGILPSEGVRLVQWDNESYAVGGEAAAGRLAGWVALSSGPSVVGIAARWFWQQYPQGFALRPDRMAYEPWADDAHPARIGMGAAKTHEFVVWVDGAGRWPAAAAAGLARPLAAAVDPEWIVRSGALPQAIAPGTAADPFLARLGAAFERYRTRNDRERWDDRAALRCDAPEPERPRVGAYGMLNWGDWNFPGYHDQTKGCDAWGNLEYDTTQVLALGYAATGDPAWLDATVAAARHFMDVDIIHFHAEQPAWVGMNHPKNHEHFSFALGGVDLGHTWTEGLISYGLLAGDDDAIAAARGIADVLVRRVDGGVWRGNPRQWGWPQIALLAVYEATRETRYLTAARAYARGGMRGHAPTATHWKMGILADALAMTHAATGDAEIEEWLRRYADAVASDPNVRDPRFFPAVAYVAGLTGNADLRASARAAADKLELGNWGKPMTIAGRVGFRLESVLAAVADSAPVTAGRPR